MLEVKFYKVRNVKLPRKNVESDAGIDFFIPEKEESFIEDLRAKNKRVHVEGNSIVFQDTNNILIPSGIKSIIPQGYCLVAFNRSSVSSKIGLDIGACVIDEAYRGEIHLHFFYTKNEPLVLEFGQKIAQFLLLPVPKIQITELDQYPSDLEDRGGGFGSSDKKEVSYA
jgi:dUTP pyrophosphatase